MKSIFILAQNMQCCAQAKHGFGKKAAIVFCPWAVLSHSIHEFGT